MGKISTSTRALSWSTAQVAVLHSSRSISWTSRAIQVPFHEDEHVPADARVVGHTWLKANKDNTPDRRFRDNRQIPVALYGWLEFRSGGLHEAYMVSNADAAAEFATAFDRYRRALAAFAARGGIVDGDGNAPLIEPASVASEDAEESDLPGGASVATPRRFGLGFPATDLAAAAILAWVVIGGLPPWAPAPPEPAACVSEAPVQPEPAAGVSEAPVQPEPAAGVSDRYWVTTDRLKRRTCPSTACGIVGQLFFREGTTVYEQTDGWARISNYYTASCVNGRNEYVDSGNSRCTPDNGIVEGKFAEWVSADFLSQDRPLLLLRRKSRSRSAPDGQRAQGLAGR